MIIAKHPLKDITLTFYPFEHKYIDNINNQYLSVGEWVYSHFEKFDSEKIATRCAIKRGVTKESLLAEWKKAGDDATLKGNTIHEMILCKFTARDFSISEQNKSIKQQYERHVEGIYKGISKELDPVFFEQIIFDPDRKIAGTCDALFVTKKKDKYVLIDWKTPKKIEKFNLYGKWAKFPYTHLADCNYNQFCLQLSLYSKILETQGYLKYNIPIIQKIIHILPDKVVSINANKIIV